MQKKKYEDTPGVIWHVDLIEALEDLPPETRDRLFMGSLYYRRDGIEPDFSDDPFEKMFWRLYQPRMDYDEAGFFNSKKFGSLGGKYRAYRQECLKNGEEPFGFELWKEVFMKDEPP